jgi:hypothetical protein
VNTSSLQGPYKPHYQTDQHYGANQSVTKHWRLLTFMSDFLYLRTPILLEVLIEILSRTTHATKFCISDNRPFKVKLYFSGYRVTQMG